MTSARLYLSAGWGIARRDALLYFSYPFRLISRMVSIVMTLAIFYYVSRLVGVDRFPDPDVYFAFVVVGMAMLEVLTATLTSVPQTVRSELMTGTFERLVISPLGPIGGILSMTVFPLLMALVAATLTIVLGGLVFGMSVTWSTVALAVPVAVVGTLAFIPLVLLAASAVLVFKQAATISTYFVTGMALVGGAFFPVTLLPGWLQWMSEVQPLTPALELLRYLIIGLPIDGSAMGNLAKLLAFSAVVFPLGFLALASGVRTCRRRGTLTEF